MFGDNNMVSLIGLVGPMCSGKTTLANHLHEHFQYTVLSYAMPLKRIVALWDMPDELETFIYSMPWKNKLIAEYVTKAVLQACDEFKDELTSGKKPRNFLQCVGNEILRATDNNIALKCMDEKIAGCNYVIDDIRFQNELDFVKEHRGITVRCYVDEKVRQSRIERLYGAQADNIMSHESEKAHESLKTDYVIDTTVGGFQYDAVRFVYLQD